MQQTYPSSYACFSLVLEKVTTKNMQTRFQDKSLGFKRKKERKWTKAQPVYFSLVLTLPFIVDWDLGEMTGGFYRSSCLSCVSVLASGIGRQRLR